ncbi:MAG TPA: hypothetical protein VF483_03870 [Gemmatimonadaceae bacterium]
MTTPATVRREEDGSFVRLIALVLRHPRLLFGIPFVAGIIGGAISLTRDSQYVSSAELKPRSANNQLASFAGLAAQLGVNGGSFGAGEGVEYYAEALRSNEILGAVATARYDFSKRAIGETSQDSVHGTLMDIWEIKARNNDARRYAAIRRLRASIVVRPDIASGLLRLSVSARWPDLAVQINRRFLEALDTFNLRTRRSQATAQREFVEKRLEVKRAELTAAEDELAAFDASNRIASSPNRALERARLARRVDVSQQVYMTLAQSYEQARIDEVRDTPVITVVDAPENTVERAGGLLLNAVLGAFAGLLVALAAILIRAMWARQVSEHPDDASALNAELRALFSRLQGRR